MKFENVEVENIPVRLWNKVKSYMNRRGFTRTVMHMFYVAFDDIRRPFIAFWKFGLNAPEGIKVDADAFVSGVRYMKIGNKFHAGAHMWLNCLDNYHGQSFSPCLEIGDNVSFSYYGHIGCVNHIKIGNNVLFGSKCYLTDHNHGCYSGDNVDSPFTPPLMRQLNDDGEIIIDDNVWVGDNVTILPNVHIGCGAIIGANAVVTHDIPGATIAIGIPASPVKMWSEEKQKWIRVKS